MATLTKEVPDRAGLAMPKPFVKRASRRSFQFLGGLAIFFLL